MICRHLSIKILAFIVAGISSLQAYNFDKCREFYLSNSKVFSGIRAIHIGGGKYLAYSKDSVESSLLIKKDETFGLYLFKDSPLKSQYNLIKANTTIKTIAINADNITQGNITKSQESYTNYANFSREIKPNSIISDICYQFYGVSIGGRNFIDKTYIDKFLNDKRAEIRYGYVGIYTKDSQMGVMIDKLNPFFARAYPSLQEGDIILSVNKKNIANTNDWTNIIFENPINSEINLTLKRGDEIFSQIVPISPRTKELMSEVSALSFLGIIVDKDLVVTSNLSPFAFKVGDKILRTNQIEVKNINELDNAIDKALSESGFLSFLLKRQGFELFITIGEEWL